MKLDKPGTAFSSVLAWPLKGKMASKLESFENLATFCLRSLSSGSRFISSSSSNSSQPHGGRNTSASMLNIPQEIEISDSTKVGTEVENKLLNITTQGNDFTDSNDVSPHYNDGITDLESSIENLRKLLEENNHELSSNQTIMNPSR